AACFCADFSNERRFLWHWSSSRVRRAHAYQGRVVHGRPGGSACNRNCCFRLRMRVLYVNSTIYDFLTATIIEGLNELSQEAPIQLVTTAASNYSRFWQVWPRQKIYREKRSFDLVILGTNVGVDLELFWDVARSGRTICIDGADTPEFTYSAS